MKKRCALRLVVVASLPFALAGGMLTASFAQAAEYHVDGQAGDDMAAGGRSSPWKTLQRAGRLRAGDIVNVRPGTYDVGTSFSIQLGGKADAYIVYKAADPAQRPVITNSQGDNAAVKIDAPYVEFRGFEIRNSQGSGIQLYAADYTRIIDNVIHGSMGGGVWVGARDGRKGPATVGVLVQGNHFYNNGRDNEKGALKGGWTGAITGQNTQNFQVLDNHVHDNWGEGIVFNLTKGSLARGNLVYDNWAAQLYMDNAQDSTFERNFAYLTGNPAYSREIGGVIRQPSGIQFANEKYTDLALPIDNVKIINNIVVGGFASIFYGSYEAGGGMKNSLIANNTFYNPTDEVIHIESDPHSLVLANNIFHAGMGKGLVYVGKQGNLPMFHHNAFMGVVTRGLAGSDTDVRVEPGFAMPGTLKPEAYKIAAGSPMIGKGAALPDVKGDYWGGARGATNDIGAHQVGATPVATDGGTTTPVPTPSDGGATTPRTDGGTSTPARDGGAGTGGTGGAGGSGGTTTPRRDAGASPGPGPTEPEPEPQPSRGAGGGCSVGTTGASSLPALLVPFGLLLAGLARRRRPRA